MKYICNTCKQTFDIVGKKDDLFPCPYCFSDNIDDVETCVVCGNLVRGYQICLHTSDDVCESCMDNLLKKARSILHKELTEREYEIFSDYFDLEAGAI